MKIISLALFLCASFASFSQSTFYSTDGNNRLTTLEFEKTITETKALWQQNINQEITVFAKTTKTEKKKDSIIHFVSLDIQMPGPLNEYVDKKLPENPVNYY